MREIYKEIRENLGISRYALAKELGVSTHAIQNAETSEAPRSRIHVDTLCRLRKVSGMTWAQFGKRLDEEFLEE